MRGVLIALILVTLGCGRVGFGTRPPGDGGGDDGGDDAPDGSVPVATCMQTMPTGTVLHVDAALGDDVNSGSAANPVRTISRAIALAQPGATILVEPGVYNAEPQNELHIENRDLRLISAQRYRASFPRFECLSCDGLLVEGFEITGSAATCAQVSFGVNVTLRDNIIHGCGQAAVRFAGNITGTSIVGNVVYDAPNALIHINDDSTVNIVDNVVFDSTGQSSYPLLWMEGTINTVVARNVVFLSKHTSSGYGTISIGSAQNLVIENNIVGPNDLGSDRGGAVGLDDADGTATIRFNTFLGPLPGPTFAVTRNAGITAPSTFTVTHNIWWSFGMTSQSFSTAAEDGSDGFTLDRNLYFNGGGAFMEPSGRLGPSDDPRQISADPQLALGSGPAPAAPVWSPTARTFADGSTTTCDLRTKLIDTLGKVPVTSPIAGRAMIAPPPTDIRGKARPMPAALGAYEP